MGGDFNAIRHPGERLGASRITRHMWQFNEFIQSFDLVDLPLHGTSFTWFNHRDRCVSNHLDCCLLSPDWLD